MSFENVIGKDEKLKAILKQVEMVAPQNIPVLILGESGTGKEILAKAIHDNSKRSSKSFIAVNCMALSKSIIESELFGHEKGAFTGASKARKGRFEAADGGTLFLDEIGELTQDIQVKLLRAIQEQCFERVGGTKTINVDIRLITATNVNLKKAISEKRFREDLYFRINTFTFNLPPLRERGDDVLLLADFLINRQKDVTGKQISGLSKGASILFKEYVWPGNIRELKNAIEYAFILETQPEIQPENLPPTITGKENALKIGLSPKLKFENYPTKIKDARKQFDIEFCKEILIKNKGNKIKSAKETGVTLREFTKLTSK